MKFISYSLLKTLQKVNYTFSVSNLVWRCSQCWWQRTKYMGYLHS